MDLDLLTRDVQLVSDVKSMIREIIWLKLSPWQRCLVPENNNLSTILVACDGSTMAASASVYLLSTPTLSGTEESNIAVASSLISKFSIPLNESKASLLGIETVTNMVKVIKRHPDLNPSKLKIDQVLDDSCLGHLLRSNISIRNRVINNIVNNIRKNNLTILKLLSDTAIRYGWGRGKKNPADLTSKLFLTPSKIINPIQDGLSANLFGTGRGGFRPSPP